MRLCLHSTQKIPLPNLDRPKFAKAKRLRRHWKNQEGLRYFSLCWHKQFVAQQKQNLESVCLVPLRLDSSSLYECRHKLALSFPQKHKRSLQCILHHKCIITNELWLKLFLTLLTIQNLDVTLMIHEVCRVLHITAPQQMKHSLLPGLAESPLR